MRGAVESSYISNNQKKKKSNEKGGQALVLRRKGTSCILGKNGYFDLYESSYGLTEPIHGWYNVLA